MSREHAYAYEAGYRDGSVHYELEYCPACKNVADLQEALDENALLRQQLADVTESMGRVEERCAKLRELLARVERARRDLCDAYPDAELLNCEECPAWSECKGDLADRMRELGVEVP